MSQSVAAEPVPVVTDADGVMRVAGTRVPLDTVVAAYEKGETPEQIAQDYSALETAYYSRPTALQQASYGGHIMEAVDARWNESDRCWRRPFGAIFMSN